MKALLLVLLSLVVIAGCSTPPSVPGESAVDLPGQRPGGAVRLPNQWWLRPVGKQIALGDFPVNMALHPSGKYIAILHSGYGQNEVITVDFSGEKIISRVAINEGFYGLAFSRDGKELFCSGAGDEVVHAFTVENGFMAGHRELRLRDDKTRGIPSGLAVSSDGAELWTANVWGQSITVSDARSGMVLHEIQLSINQPAPRTNVAVVASADEAAITKRAEAVLDDARSDDPFPYACVLDEPRNRVYVSLWAQAAVIAFDTKTREKIARWEVEEHPNEMLLSKSGKHLFVANANRNSVSIVDTQSGRTVETLLAELQPGSPPGSTPNSLALDPDEKLLFVANAGINTVAVFDISTIGKSRSLGFIPVGWYPTSVRVSLDGKHLLVANGKGLISQANRYGPQPGNDAPASLREYIGGLFRGTLSVIALPAGEKLEQQLKRWTAQAYRCMPAPLSSITNRAPENPVPLRAGDATPIKYCIYIIKENRTYDQVLGDMPEGNGDRSLCLFPERVTPNHHKLAREFVLLDNFYVESEVSADGHEWTMGAYATDFVEKTWPLTYGHNKHKKYPYPAEGNFPIATPAGGYLWDRAREAGVSYRSYGEFVNNGKTTNDPATSRVKTLQGHFDPWFRGFDMDYPDVLRAKRFISELQRFEREGEMPRLQMVRLPNDHTSGTATNKLTPMACVGDNDLAFGMVIEAITRSRFWAKTAVFVVEDDAQNGPDHVDAHRTIAYVISPYAKRRSVDSTMYSTSSMLRTMELILGLKPMSQFDAAALPMFNSFHGKADLRPYTGVPVIVDLNERNSRTAWGAKLSQKMDFTKEDAADDILLNEVIWRSVRGPDSAMPAPTRAAFVFTSRGEDDDD
jgi:DNA-binding beta-propeller fold protein YncE